MNTKILITNHQWAAATAASSSSSSSSNIVHDDSTLWDYCKSVCVCFVLFCSVFFDRPTDRPIDQNGRLVTPPSPHQQQQLFKNTFSFYRKKKDTKFSRCTISSQDQPKRHMKLAKSTPLIVFLLSKFQTDRTWWASDYDYLLNQNKYKNIFQPSWL